jgi:hypothetical protein
MIRIGDIAINPNFVITVTNDKVNNRSMVELHDNGMLTIPHSDIAYGPLVDKIDWEQRNPFR